MLIAWVIVGPKLSSAQSGATQYSLARIVSIDGSVDQKGELSRILHAVGLSGGRVAVHDAGWSGIRIFDTTGTISSSFGARGSGPGEYRLIENMGAIGDSVWYVDATLKRTSIFAPGGRLASTYAWRTKTSTKSSQDISPKGLLADRSHWGLEEAFSFADTAVRTERKLVRLSLDATSTAEVALVPAGHDYFAVPKSEPGFILGKQPFPDQPIVLSSARDARFVIVDRAARRGAANKARIFSVDGAGRKIWQRDIDVDARPIAQSLKDSIWQAQRRSVRDIPNGERLLRERLFLPDSYPLIRSAFLTRDDDLWLQLDQRNGTDQWVIVDRTGRVAGRVSAPAGLTLQAGSGTVVWGSRLDADDVPVLEAYRVSRR